MVLFLKLIIYFTDTYIYDSEFKENECFYALFRDQVLETDVKDEYILMYDHTDGKGSSKYLCINVSNPSTLITISFLLKIYSYLLPIGSRYLPILNYNIILT